MRPKLPVLAGLLCFLTAASSCGGGGAAEPQQDVPIASDLGGGDVAGERDGGGLDVLASACEEDDDCADVFADVAPCEVAVCDTLKGACALALRPDQAPCDDGDACTVGSACTGGTCGGGVPYVCDDGDPCTRDACNGSGGCAASPAEGGTTCDDGNPCTAGDVCDDSGVCAGADDGSCACAVDAECAVHEDGNACNGLLACVEGRCAVVAGSVVSCDTSGDTLCRRTRCVPATGRCESFAVEDGALCDDGDPCTSGDACDAGECGGEVGTCPCSEDADCGVFEDGDRCNGELRCVEGSCRVDPDTRVVCEDETPGDCRVPTCSPATGTCAPTGLADGQPCDDGDACTSVSTCQDGECHGSGAASACDDDNPCTDDACTPGAGCAHTPNRLPCNDGNACTIGDRCDAGVCVGGGVTPCDDDNSCTEDSCNADTGCVHAGLTGGVCEDGSPCTGSAAEPDRCSEGVCQPGALVCPCTTDEQCAAYDDGNRCNGGYRCSANQCVVDPTSVVVCPTAGDPPCVRNTCQEATGECVREPLGDGVLCDDGDPCTTADVCLAGACTAGAPMACDDADPCTADSCRAGACAHEPVPGCSGACDSIDDCVDDDPCSIDLCGPDGTCRHTASPNGTLCEDANPCTGGDVCRGGLCESGALDACAGSCYPDAVVACGETVEAATWDFASTVFMQSYPCVAGDWSGPEMAYVFAAQAAMRVTVALEEAEGLGLIVLRGADGCDALQCAGGDAAGGPLSFSVEAGMTYVLVIDGLRGASGSYRLTVSCGVGEDCRNGADDDGDGRADCADPECATVDACREQECADDLDDDGDGATDCDDADCSADVVCLPESDCDNGWDDDRDGQMDCDDADCAESATCLPESDCRNGVDDDEDGRTDCADPDCTTDVLCHETDCGNYEDDDGDGRVDCADVDCNGTPGCVEVLCGNRIDDDRDGRTDCVDEDCRGRSGCIEEACEDRADNDQDGTTDCDDLDCRDVGSCPVLCQPTAQIRCGDVLAGEAIGSGDERFDAYPGCLEAPRLGGRERVYAFAPRSSLRLIVTLRPYGFDGALAVLEGACRPPSACLAGTNDGGVGQTETVSFYATQGVPFYVVVDSVAADAGASFDLIVGCAGQPEAVCDNGADDDGDGAADCLDVDCLYVPPCVERDCANGVDDNGNGRVDCADRSCALDPGCGELDCANGQDDDLDGDVDCNDAECQRNPVCGEDCDNGIDDDGDDARDCADADCSGVAGCVEACENGVDDDHDGALDCADAECVVQPGCVETLCDDGADDDGDGAADCDDLDCAQIPPCTEVACGNRVDDDSDGATDCADVDCRAETHCRESACGNRVDDDRDGYTDCRDTDCTEAGSCSRSVCRPTAALGCGTLPGESLLAPTATDVLDRYPVCDLVGFDHSGPELAYEFRAPCTGIFSVSVTPREPTGFYNVFLLEGGAGCTPEACVDLAEGTAAGTTLTIEGLEGTPFFLVVDGVDGAAGTFDLQIDCGCAPVIETLCANGSDDDEDGDADCDDADCAGDLRCTGLCSALATVECGGSRSSSLGLSGVVEGRIDAYPSCEPYGFDYTGPETTLLFTAPCTGPVTLTTELTLGDAQVETFVLRADAAGGCVPGNCSAVAYMASAGVGQVAFGAVAGSSYYLVLDAPPDTQAALLTSLACGCVGEQECSDRIDDDGDGLLDCQDSDCAEDPLCQGGAGCAPTGPIGCEEPLTGDTSLGASFTSVYSCRPTLGWAGPEQIHRWVATSTGPVIVTLDAAPGLDLDLFVLRDEGRGCDASACVASGAALGDDTVLLDAVAGTTYYLAVDAYQASASGPYSLRVDCTPSCEATGGTLSCGSTVEGDLSGAGTTNAIGRYSCDPTGSDYSGPELVYAFESPCTGTVYARVTRSGGGVALTDIHALRPNSVCSGTCVAGAQMDSTTGVALLALDLVEGEPVLLAVDGRGGAQGRFVLELDCAECLSGDPCYGAASVACNGTFSGTTAGAESTFDFYGCGPWGWPGGDTWRAFSRPSGGDVRLSLSTDGDLGVFVIEDGGEGCDSFACVAGTDPFEPGTVTFRAAPGKRYHLVVDDRTGAGAPFALDVDCL